MTSLSLNVRSRIGRINVLTKELSHPNALTLRVPITSSRPYQTRLTTETRQTGERDMKTTLKLLLLSLTLTGSSVVGLSCETCMDKDDPNCVRTIRLRCTDGETQCVSATILTTAGSWTSTQKVKRCAAADFCPFVGTQDFSVNVGTASVLTKSRCCSTDNCNAADAGTPTAPSAGSLQCYSCNPRTGACNVQLKCNALESHCFSSLVIPSPGSSAVPTYGCASANLCAAAAYLGSFPLVANIRGVQGPATCCTRHNCNTLQPTTTHGPPTPHLDWL